MNGVKLAEGKPAEPDTHLTAMQQLDSLWWSTVERKQFFLLRPEFSVLEGVVTGAGAGGRLALPEEIELASDLGPGLALVPELSSTFLPLIALFGGIALTAGPALLSDLLLNFQTLNSLCVLDPIETRLKDEKSLDLQKVADGTPLFLATVSLETGALRYVTGRGNFVERDGVTSVASALDTSKFDLTAFSGNATDLAAAQAALADYQAKQQEVANLKEESAISNTTNSRRLAIRDQLRDLVPKAGTALRQLRAAIRNYPGVTASASVVDGVIASAAIPGIFGGRRCVPRITLTAACAT